MRKPARKLRPQGWSAAEGGRTAIIYTTCSLAPYACSCLSCPASRLPHGLVGKHLTPSWVAEAFTLLAPSCRCHVALLLDMINIVAAHLCALAILIAGLACVQGTKACLGWEGGPQGGTYACTAVVDTWLELLQLAFCAVRGLPGSGLPSTPASSRRTTAELDVRLGNALTSYSGALQDLLKQLLQHWKV